MNSGTKLFEPILDATGHESNERELEFSGHLRSALDNPRLSQNLTAFQQGWRPARDGITGEIDFPSLRSQLKRAKTAVTEDLDEYLAEYCSAAERAGAAVHFAASAEDANRIVLEIARHNAVHLIAK